MTGSDIRFLVIPRGAGLLEMTEEKNINLCVLCVSNDPDENRGNGR
jgi:hypothetical protein